LRAPQLGRRKARDKVLGRMFFFEKKNQKTFISPLRPRSWPWPDFSAVE
jgi:hypothetical protein